MYFIAEGGIATKNTLVNTKGAVSLSLNVSYIDGISLNVAYTKDEVFVIADRNSLMFTTQGSGYLQYNTYNDLLHYNVGTKVLNARVVTLKEVLEVYKETNKLLVLNLDYQGDRTAQYTYQLLDLISEYPNVNIYLKSFNEEILNILKSSNTKARIGIIINDDNIDRLDENFDFYVINSYLVDSELIVKKINNDRVVMTELINSSNDLINYYYRYGSYILNNLYIISSNTYSIYHDLDKIKFER